MNTWYFYFLLTVLLFPIVSTIQVKYGRKIGALKLSLLRQITIAIIWSPLLYFLIQKWEIIQSNIISLLLSWLFGAGYLLTAFYAMNLTSVGISRIFVAVSRTIFALIIGYFVFEEVISLYDYLWITVIFIGFVFLSLSDTKQKSPSQTLGVLVSLWAWVLFWINMLFFKQFSPHFSGLESAYLLETTNGIFLILATLFMGKKEIQKNFSLKWEKFWLLFATAPLVLVASYWLAKSIIMIPFYLVNVLFVFVFFASIIFGWIFLHEKFTLKQLASMGVMLLWCGIVVLF